jgi:hypothetical protein
MGGMAGLSLFLPASRATLQATCKRRDDLHGAAPQLLRIRTFHGLEGIVWIEARLDRLQAMAKSGRTTRLQEWTNIIDAEQP